MKTMFASWRYRLSRLALLTSLLLGGFATDLSAATLTWTGAGGDDSWHNRTNWSTLTVPGAADDAVINAPALTVVHSNGNTTVRSLQCATAFSITGGTMTLTTGASQVNGEFTMLPTTALTANGATVVCTLANTTLADSAHFTAMGGAVLTIGGLVAYQKPDCNDAFWQAIGAGSRLVFPSLLNLAGNPSCGWLRLRATGGGKLELGSVTNLADTYVDTMADGTNSLVDFSGLVSGHQLDTYAITEARNGGEVRLTQLTVSGRNHFTLRPGSTMTFPAVTNADGAGFSALDGSVIELPLVTSYTKPHCADAFFIANGAGSRLKFPALLNLSGHLNCAWLRLRAQAGGKVELGAVTNIADSYMDILAENAGSLVDLSQLVRCQQFSAYALTEARGGGEVRLSQLRVAGRMHYTLGAPGLMAFPALTNADGAGFSAEAGAVLEVPLLTRYNKTHCADAFFIATGAGSRLKFPLLTDLAGNPNCAWLRLRAQVGGKLELGAVTNIADTYVDTLAESTNSLVDLSGLVRWEQFNAYAITEARAGSEVRQSQLRIAGRTHFTLGGSGVMTFPALTNADNAGFTAEGGAVLEVPLVTRYSKPVCADTFLIATGVGSRLKFPALTNLAGSTVCAWLRLRAQNGGSLELNAVTTIPASYMDLFADGAGSVMDFSALTGYDGAAQYAIIEARNNASILLSAVTSLDRIFNLTIRNGGSIALPQLLHLTESVVVADNAIINLNTVINGGAATIQELNGGDVLINPQVLNLTVTWTGAGGDNSWHNGSNWNTGVVPGPFNDVQINLAGASVVFSSNAPAIRSFDSSRLFTLAGGTLFVSNAFTLSGGTFTLAGGILNATNSPNLTAGTLVLQGGQLAGRFRMINSAVQLAANSTASGTLVLHGNNTASGNVPSNLTVRVEGTIPQGQAILTWPEGPTNFGTIVMETTSDGGFDQSCYLTINTGALVNAAGGVIQVNRGAGESRFISGSVENWGTLTVQSNILLQFNGTGYRFTQRGGLVQADGELRMRFGRFEFQGGTLAGLVRAHDSFITVADTVTSASTVRAVGGSGVFGGNLSPTVTVWLEGENTFGYAQLIVTNQVLNRGRLLMQTTTDGGFDQSCYLTIAAGGTLENDTGAILEAQPGAGEIRNITGHLRNRGQILVGAGEEVDFNGGLLEAAGGTFDGLFFVRTSDVLATAPPATPTTLMLVGGSDRLLTDIPTNLTLWVRGSTQHGHAILTLPEGRTNHGVLRLETFSDGGFDQSCYLTISTGALVNAAGGVIQVNRGAGESRFITGNVENWGTLNVQSNILLQLNGSGHRFTQRSGLVQADGELRLRFGRFEFLGGTLAGLVRAQDSFITVADTVTSTSTVRAVGGSGVFGGNLSATVTVWLEGENTFGYAQLIVTNQVLNRGRLLMQTTSDGGFDQSCYLTIAAGGTLDNDTSAILEAQPGAGEIRNITGHLRNRGQILVGAGEEVDFNAGILEAAGGTFDGLFFVRTSDVLATAPPATPTTLMLVGGSDRLLTDIPTNLTLWVRGSTQHGHAVVTLPEGRSNHGVLRLETFSDGGFDQSCYLTISAGALVNSPGGLIQVNQGAGESRFINGAVTNQGVFAVQDITATMWTGPFVNDVTGLVSGPGTINVNGISFVNNGTVSPGASPGLLSFTGDYAQGPAGQLNIEIAGANVATDYDRLAISGSATLDGKLNVTILDDFLPAVSNVFRVMTYGSVAGQFAELNGLNIYTNRSLTPAYLATAFDLTAIEATNVIVTKPSIVSQPTHQNIINGQTATFRVTANGTRPFEYQWLWHGTNLPGANDDTLVLLNAQTNQSGPYQVVITNSAGSVTSAIANLIVRPVADLVISDITNPTNALAGQPIQLTWLSRNQGSQSALAPWTETVSLSVNSNGTPLISVANFTITNSFPAGQSQIRTQSVITPGGLDGNYYVVVTTDTGNQVAEELNETNNVTVGTNVIRLRSPDLQPRNLQLAGGTAVFGQSINVSWLSTNSGSAPALSAWNDRVYLGTNNSNLVGATELTTIAVTGVPLAEGGVISNSVNVLLPLTAQSSPGSYFILVSEDHGNATAESIETNNLAAAALNLTLPPLPDLAVTNVAGPANALPGQLISVSWAVTNRGNLGVNGIWSDTIYLATNSAGDGLTQLGTFAYSNALPVGGSITRTQQVFVPVTSPLGSLFLAVQADSLAEVVEESDLNNIGVAANATVIPAVLTLQLPAAEVAEGSPQPLLVSITRNGPRSSPLTVTLTNGDPTELSMPTNVVIAVGQASASFEVFGLPDGFADGSQLVTIGAGADSFAGAAAQITVLDVDLPRFTIQLATDTTSEGMDIAATVSRDAGTNEAVVVTLASSSPGQLNVPPGVTIPAGQFSAAFIVSAGQDPNLELPNTYGIAATAEGYVEDFADVTVLDDDLPGLTLTLSRTNLAEGDASPVTATLTRATPGFATLSFGVTSSDATEAIVPPDVVLPAGETSVQFTISAVDDALVDGPQPVTIIVMPRETGSGRDVPPALVANLTVADNDGPSLTVVIERDLVAEGLNPATTGIVRRNVVANTPLNVSLLSSDPSEATVPISVTILANEAEAGFNLVSINDGVTDGNQPVTITASAAGFSPGVDNVVVSDVNQPDLIITSIGTPASALTEADFVLTYRDSNLGLGNASGSWSQEIFLSRDRVLDADDQLLGEFPFNGTIPPGLFFERALQFRLPREAGDYWAIVRTDPDNTVLEALEDNNLTVAANPIHVNAAYSAIVQTSFERGLAGTPVEMTGSATRAGGGPAAFELVNIHLKVRDTVRVIAALTDQNGNFAATFRPLLGEAGHYTIGAAHPGAADAPMQDAFDLLGMKFEPSSVAHVLPAETSLTNIVILTNRSELPITGLVASALSVPAGVAVVITPHATTLPGSGGITVGYSITSTANTAFAGVITLRISSTEGAVANLPVDLRIESRTPRLVANPGSLTAGMLRGAQTAVGFTIINEGGLATGPLNVLLPPDSFFHLATPSPLPPLPPGGSNLITILLTPDTNTPLSEFRGALVVTDGTSAELAVPFAFRAISDNVGSLRVEAVDEYTFYAEGSPRVANATITLKDALTRNVVTNGVADTNGLLLLHGVREGYYTLEASADQHNHAHEIIFITAGITNDARPFLARQTVQYLWTVEPTEVEDRTRITIETIFETVVPIPVVTIHPNVIDLAEIQQDVTQIDLVISNHGLIAALELNLNFGTHPEWEFTPLVREIGDLPARSSLTIPLTIRRLNQRPDVKAAGGAQCGISASLLWSLICDDKKTYGVPITINNIGPCPGGGGVVYPCCGGGGGGVIYPPAFVGCNCIDLCDPCAQEMAEALLECVIGFLPLPDVVKCGKGLADCYNEPGVLGCAGAGLDCLAAVGKKVPIIGQIISGLDCMDKLLSACDGPGLWGTLTGSGRPDVKAAGGHSVLDFPGIDEVLEQSRRLNTYREMLRTLIGDDAWFHENQGTNFGVWLEAFGATIAPASDAGQLVSAPEQTLLLGTPFPDGLAVSNVVKFIERWNRTVNYDTAGIRELIQVPLGQSPDFIVRSAFSNAVFQMNAAIALDEADGYADAMVGLGAKVDQLRQNLIAASQTGGTCARVKLRLEQEAVLTRDGFNATLEILNNSTSPLENVSVDLIVKSEDGTIATDLFGIRPPTLTAIGDVDGSGSVVANTSAKASWIIIPTDDAAPVSELPYYVSGTLSYEQDGATVTVPLAPVRITVFPNPSLVLKYFHERDVRSDDPFTDPIEPSIPYSLAVMAINNGPGIAKNLRITSGKPQIVENEKGLLIGFDIIATEVAGQNLTPSLTADFGTLNAGQIGIARWLFKSTLQGQFISYEATFEHLDGLGDPRLSLIDGIEIHELIHIVRATGAFEDAKPDFLVNDFNDFEVLPDKLYLSDGSIASVSAVTEANASGPVSSGNLSITLTAALPGGWAYLRANDPGQGDYRLIRVRRSDGTELPVDNFWTTDRTFVGGGRRPTYEDKLHLFDYNSTGSYTLDYAPLLQTDVISPVSAVTPTPASSYPTIPLSWGGQDNIGGTGLSFFDVFASVDGGPFTRHVERTTATGLLYQGQHGHSYAFYTVATDNAGNAEPAPGVPDAQTIVALTNHPPVLTVLSNVLVIEGETLSLDIDATDPDGGALTFSLLPGAPAGMAIHPVSGLLTWVTGEAHGPSTNPVTVQVLDNGLPRLGDTASFSVIVLESNTPPVLPAITNRTISEGQLLAIANVAQDFDVPAQMLTFSLGNGTPAGATINTSTGLFTWRPSDFQGGTTNVISVIVRDNNQPSGSATQSFTVIVRDTRPDLVLGIGNTAVLSGQTSSVPLTLRSGVDVTNLHLTLAVSGDRVTNVSVQALAPEVASANFQALGSNRFAAQFHSRSDTLLQGDFVLAQLAFGTVSNLHSAVAILRGETFSGDRASSTNPIPGNAGTGRAFIIGREPILDANGAPNNQLALTLYAIPGERYAIERRAPLTGTNDWMFDSVVDQLGLATFLPLRSALGGSEFFRALQIPESELTIRIEGNQVVLEWPLICAGCVLEESGQLGAAAIWTPAGPLPQVINGRYRVTITIGLNPRFYRLAVAP